ncbi:peroxisomal membrane protein pxmp2 4-like protein [Phytophthora ramorum]
MTEQDAQHPRKKHRLGGVASPATAAIPSSRAKFAFGSRLPDAGKSLLRGPKISGKSNLQASTRLRAGHAVWAPANPRKRRRSNSDDATARTKPSHRRLTVKTTLPLHDSHLPAPTTVSGLLTEKHLHTISPSNPATRSKKRKPAAPLELEADLAATEPAFWIKRREAVEAALKEMDTIEKRIVSITK